MLHHILQQISLWILKPQEVHGRARVLSVADHSGQGAWDQLGKKGKQACVVRLSREVTTYGFVTVPAGGRPKQATALFGSFQQHFATRKTKQTCASAAFKFLYIECSFSIAMVQYLPLMKV